MGPFSKRENHLKNILETFNDVSERIKLSIEIPDRVLNVLDISIWIENNKINYKHYIKEIRSDNCLRKNSWPPNHVKSIFIEISIITAVKRSSEGYQSEAKASDDNRTVQEEKLTYLTFH